MKIKIQAIKICKMQQMQYLLKTYGIDVYIGKEESQKSII